MIREVRMPALGQTTDELRITRWLKREGDAVTQGDPLFEVETDKATLEVEAFSAGILLKILHGANDIVEVGFVVAYIGASGDVIPAGHDPAASIAAPTVPIAVPALPADAMTLPALPTDAVGSAPHARSQPGKVLASPAVRALAHAHGIDLRLVKGGGPGGRIERQDVQSLIDQPSTLPAVQGHDAPVARHREIMARRLTQSIQTIPQIALTATVEMRNARAMVEAGRAQGIARLTYTHLVLRAVAVALRSHPRMNTLWLADGPTLRQLPHATVGLAVAGEDTLVVVTIPEPDTLSLAALVAVTDGAIARARTGSLIAADVARRPSASAIWACTGWNTSPPSSIPRKPPSSPPVASPIVRSCTMAACTSRHR